MGKNVRKSAIDTVGVFRHFRTLSERSLFATHTCNTPLSSTPPTERSFLILRRLQTRLELYRHSAEISHPPAQINIEEIINTFCRTPRRVDIVLWFKIEFDHFFLFFFFFNIYSLNALLVLYFVLYNIIVKTTVQLCFFGSWIFNIF